MANYNGARYLAEAVGSVLAQTLRDLELLIADDASTDDSVSRIASIAARDKRVRLIRSDTNLGPAGARNLCLAAATGRWVAIVDNDDILHPDRLARLIAAAEEDRADIAADDLLIFDDDPAVEPGACLHGHWARSSRQIDATTYVRGNALFSGAQALGYLKPVIRAGMIAAAGIRYDATLRVGEDYDFILRLLLAGAGFRVYPDLLYFYRKHRHSISHRLSRAVLEPLLAAHDRVAAEAKGGDRGFDAAMAGRRASLRKALRFEDLVGALKLRLWPAAMRLAIRYPAVALMLHRPVLERLRRVRREARGGSDGRRQVSVLSRQRMVGATNGSSAYLLGLCQTLRDNGCDVHLIWPSPVVFGRWPWLSLRPEMDVFASISIRGGMRFGHRIVATDLQTLARAARAALGMALLRLGVPVERLTRRAPYAIGAPWLREDLLFVARRTRRPSDVVVADYAFLTEGIPYTLSPGAMTAVVMHDLFSSRRHQFDRWGASDSVSSLDQATEMRLLGQADVVIAIQEAEAAAVRACLPERRVVTAPMAVLPVARPQPGSGLDVLFVGSDTAPNVIGLQWFIDTVWSEVRSAVPQAQLRVAGSVCSAISAPADGVTLLGVVPELAAEYRDAAVVISPLLAGSGLKIKLVEALGNGKAVVATAVTLQGVEAFVGGAVELADTPGDFATAVTKLLLDDARRTARAVAALEAARRHFSAEACYGAFVLALTRPASGARSSDDVAARDAPDIEIVG
jgi:succinoglycan biosynthesis protein ExoO